jgi:hypothetical protein
MFRFAAAAALAAAYATAQTRPRPEQIRNIEQIRVCRGCGDDRQGTLVLTRQLQDGRHVDAPPDLTDPADAGLPTVCVTSYYRVTIEAAGHNVQTPACYTQYGLALLLLDPTWLEWWNAHKPPAP